jgi:hypothetical protein
MKTYFIKNCKIYRNSENGLDEIEETVYDIIIVSNKKGARREDQFQ